MKIVTATEARNQLKELLDAVEKDEGANVLVKRNSKPVAMLLNAKVAEKMILCAFAQGVLTRGLAMQQLGLSWYGDLLCLMNRHGIRPPSVSPEDEMIMKRQLDAVFQEAGRSK